MHTAVIEVGQSGMPVCMRGPLPSTVSQRGRHADREVFRDTARTDSPVRVYRIQLYDAMAPAQTHGAISAQREQ